MPKYECWWYDKEEVEERTAHVINGSDLYFQRFTSYCGRIDYLNTKNWERKKSFGNLSKTISEGNKICLECWKNIPNRTLMKLTHLLQ